jgi:hypothetical protein
VNGPCGNTKRISKPTGSAAMTVTPNFGAWTRGDNTTYEAQFRLTITAWYATAFSNLRSRRSTTWRPLPSVRYGQHSITGRPMRMRLMWHVTKSSCLQLEALATNRTTAKAPIASSAQSAKTILVMRMNYGNAQRRRTMPARRHVRSVTLVPPPCVVGRSPSTTKD